MESNFKFLKTDSATVELYRIISEAEEYYCKGDYNMTLTKVKKVAENTALLIADKEELTLQEKSTFEEVLRGIRNLIPNPKIVDDFYEIEREVKNSTNTKSNALKALNIIFEILVWVMLTYINQKIKKSAIGEFLEPQLEQDYSPLERKIIYVQTVNNESGQFSVYEGAQKIGDATISSSDIETDWSPNSEFLRKIALKRIDQYMKTAGLPPALGWTELAYKKSTKTWFRDHDVHAVLKRSGIKKAELLNGQEWFKTDLETAKLAIKAVKEGRSFINSSLEEPFEEGFEIQLRPEQENAVKQTQKVFKDKDRMLWNAKMRFGKTLTALQLVKNEQFQRVLIMTHRPVVSDSWFDDFKKMKMSNEGYDFGSVNRGEKLEKLKQSDKPFVYFASIQLLRHNNGQTNLKDFADVDWDLIIIDEAHEGTQTELTNKVLRGLVGDKTKILELSGTPFNILNQFDEEQVYTWDYVMEQAAKEKWELEYPNEPNPYESLPKVLMYTFEMRNKEKFADESKAFNFREFFRVDDHGDFVHKEDVRKFLDNITNPAGKTNYPFSTKEYREELRHTLWVMPGVKEANALEKMLTEHPVFGMDYEIVNIVKRDIDDDGIANDADIEKVRAAISDPSKTKTITLTVRRLTTGVNIPEWTAVMFLSNTNSAMNYLQAAFRAQTPFSHEKLGMKKKCYIFDFAPDRALTVMAESAQINSGVGKKNTQEQKLAMARLLNFMPILGNSDTGMKSFNVDRMLTQLKKVYAEKAVRSGFEDDSIYNDNLLTLTADDASMFNQLNAIVGKTQNQKTSKKIIVNENGLTDEQYDQAEKAKKKPAKQRTAEELELLEKVKEARKQRKAMISILRGVSIRIPMMIYGMAVDLSKDITIQDFVNQVDEESWKEFMPKGFTKGMFSEIAKYYDAEVFIEAGRIIRQRAKSFDSLDFINRAEKIAELFGTFKNPDKETVLTPWRVVNLQVNKSVGGLNFYDDNYESVTDGATSNLHWVENENTAAVYNSNTKIIDVNSKTGLYPLHSAISLYYQRIKDNDDNYFEADRVYQEILENNIYAVAKTPMAKTITERTLVGYRNYKTNVVYIENLNEILKKDVDEGKEIIEEVFGNVKFDVVIGNPPYQEGDNSTKKGSAKPLYNMFMELAISLSPKYITLITPSVWFLGGKGLDGFRSRMLGDKHFKIFNNYLTPNDVFTSVNLRGGVNYFLWDKSFNNTKKDILVNNFKDGKLIDSSYRPYRLKDMDIFVVESKSYFLISKLIENKFIDVDYENSDKMLYRYISERNPFGIPTTFKLSSEKSKNEENLKVYASKGKIGYIRLSEISKNQSFINKYKVLTAFANNISTDLRDDNLNTIVAEPFEICTETYLMIGAGLDLSLEAANNLSKYLTTKFVRYLIGVAKANQNGTRKTYRFIPHQDFTLNSDVDWSQSISEIDQQLYRKYDLTQEEIDFIESKVKEME